MLIEIIKKEFLLVSRDIHALMVLFVMPMAFILIMSLSLQNTFQQDTTDKPKIGVIFENQEDSISIIGKMFTKINGFHTVTLENMDNIRIKVQENGLTAIIYIPHKFNESLKTGRRLDEGNILKLYYPPSIPNSMRKLIYASISEKLVSYQVEKLFLFLMPDKERKEIQFKEITARNLIQEYELYKTAQNQRPNSVEQTVPAWLIFSMFFVVIPISTTFLMEKQLGTLQRLKTLPVPDTYFLLGKLLPYLCINMFQTILMFLVGIYLLPLLSGQGIHLGTNAWLLIPMSVSVSVAAISFALLIATLVKTTEQATTIGGVSNLILGALGGIMVPTFVMPKIMQTIARYSPMNWGLEGYLTIILRQGNFSDVLHEIWKLLMLGAILFALAIWSYKRDRMV